MRYTKIENNRSVINVYWETWDKNCFHINLEKTVRGVFGYLKRKTFKLAEIDYYPEDRSDEVLINNVKLIVPIVRNYAKNNDAKINWGDLTGVIDRHNL